MSDIGFAPITNHQSSITSLKLSVVIPTYNQADLLRECLRSLVDQTIPRDTYEVFVVDDGSTDQTQAVCSEFAAHVKSIRFPANRGRSAARNAGIQEARAPLIAFVDSDVLVGRSFLETHLKTYHQNGPRVLSRGPVVIVSSVEAAKKARVPRLSASPAYLDTANVLVEKSALVEAGLFDEGFPGYGWEDFELGMRLKRLGVRRIFCRDAIAFHVQTDSRSMRIDNLLRKEEERAKSAVYFYRKHPTLETRLLIQATPLHRAAFWLQSAGGSLTPHNITPIARWLRNSGAPGLAYVALRGVLNGHYLQSLRTELKSHVAALA